MTAHLTSHSDSGHVAVNSAPKNCGSQSYFSVGEITPPGQHHYPAEPDSVRSAAFPHMFVTGDTRDMLFADVALMRKMQNAVDDDLEEALENWSQHHTTRARQYVQAQITRVRLLRGARLNAWRRLIDGRSARSVG